MAAETAAPSVRVAYTASATLRVVFMSGPTIDMPAIRFLTSCGNFLRHMPEIRPLEQQPANVG